MRGVRYKLKPIKQILENGKIHYDIKVNNKGGNEKLTA